MCGEDSDVPYFSKALAKLDDSHFYKLVQIDGKLNVLCQPCSAVKNRKKYVELGSKEKAFSNLKAHIKTRSHTQNTLWYRSGEIRKKECDAKREKEESKRKALEEVQRLYKGMFEEVKDNAMENVRCMICNELVKIQPERGSFVFNAGEHAKKHAKESGKRKQASINSYFQPKKSKVED